MKKFLLTIAPTISGIAITISYLPQLWLTFTSKNVSGQSLEFWLLLDLALIGLFLQQVGIIKYTDNKNYTGVTVQFLNLFFALIMTSMVILFK